MSIKQQFQTALTDSFSIYTGQGQAPYDRLGDLRWEAGGSGLAGYKFVKASGTTASAIGDFMCYTDTSLQIVDGANAAIPAGVAQFAVVAGTPLVGWIQFSGLATLNTDYSTAPVAGEKVTNTGAAAKTLKVAAALTDGPVGIAVDAVSKVQLMLHG